MGTAWDSLIAGYTEGTSASPSPDAPPSAPSQPSNPWERLITSTRSPSRNAVDYNFVVQGLVQRGLPQHVAEGFAMNIKDESGFDSGINEVNPTVPGSRGGYGLYQVTGPRRRQYEDFARQRNSSLDNPETTLDFLVWELDNTEKRARDRILATKTSGEAGAAIVNDFLRPAKVHRVKRASKYLGTSGTREQATPSTRLWLDF